MKAFKILTLCICLMVSGIIGCSTGSGGSGGSGGSDSPEPVSTDSIIEKYTESYISISNIDTNTDNNDIAAMLQTITVKLIRMPSESWAEVDAKENAYMISLSTNFISDVHTLKASSNEIEIVDGFCDEIIYYYSVTESGYYMVAGELLGDAAGRFIVKMDKHEYKKIKNTR